MILEIFYSLARNFSNRQRKCCIFIFSFSVEKRFMTDWQTVDSVSCDEKKVNLIPLRQRSTKIANYCYSR